MGKNTVYGPGGYDPQKPDNNVVEESDADPAATPTVSEVDETLATVAGEVVK